MNIKTVSISVNYSDLLAYTWARNKLEISDFTVITDSKDSSTQNFCQKENINLFITDAFYSDGCPFSKSNALNTFFSSEIKPDNTEWILLLDSDIVINNALKDFQQHYYARTLDSVIIPNQNNVGTGIPVYLGPKTKQKIKPKILYDISTNGGDIHGPNDIFIEECLFSCPRKIYNTKNNYKKNICDLTEHCFFFGYFHLFHINAIKDKLLNSQPVFNHYAAADKYDMDFAREYWAFPQKKTLNLPVDHLGPIGANWKGRESEKWCD